MDARFFVDENDLALAKALDEQYGDVVYPGHVDLPEVPRQTDDDVWLPVVGRRRLAVITRDRHIRYRPAEKAAWVAHHVRGFVLTGRESQSTAASKALLDGHWEEIGHLVEQEPDGPWMRAVTKAGLRSIDLVQRSD